MPLHLVLRRVWPSAGARCVVCGGEPGVEIVMRGSAPRRPWSLFPSSALLQFAPPAPSFVFTLRLVRAVASAGSNFGLRAARPGLRGPADGLALAAAAAQAVAPPSSFPRLAEPVAANRRVRRCAMCDLCDLYVRTDCWPEWGLPAVVCRKGRSGVAHHPRSVPQAPPSLVAFGRLYSVGWCRAGGRAFFILIF